MAQFNFGGVMEEVITDEEFPLQKAREILKDEIVAVLGYGVQGPGQALNMRDNGINVIVGQRENRTFAPHATVPPGIQVRGRVLAAGPRLCASVPATSSFASFRVGARAGSPGGGRGPAVGGDTSGSLRLKSGAGCQSGGRCGG